MWKIFIVATFYCVVTRVYETCFFMVRCWCIKLELNSVLDDEC